MPDSAGKRQRREAKARKAASREQRRLERNRRRQTGEPQAWLLEDEPEAEPAAADRAPEADKPLTR